MKIRNSVIVGLLALVVGCGESIEHKLEQARISLNSGRPDAALTFAQAVLAERPGDPAAMLLMAKAHLRLRNYEESRNLLRKLIALDSSKSDFHRELLNLVLAEMTDLLGASEFNTNATLAERFTAAKEQGHEQADWLIAAKETAAGEFARARLLILDSQRIDRLVREEEIRLRGEAGEREPGAPVSSPAVEEQRRQIKGLLLTAEKHLENTLAAEPTHFSAAGTLVRLCRAREGWNDLWVLAEKLSSREDLPSPLASELVGDILNIPDRLYAEPVRLVVCRKLLGAVSAQGKASPQWKIVRARLHLRDREKDKAMELAQEAFRAQPADAEARLTYAWCLYETAQFPLAKTMLETLAAERRDHEHVQFLYGLTLIKTGDRTLAVEALKRTTEINPSNQLARSAFVSLMSENRDTVSAVLEEINKLYQSNPGDPEALRFKFIAEVAAGNLANIKALMGSIEKLSPRKVGHLRVLVDGSVFLRDLASAHKYAIEVINLDPDRIESHVALARVHLLRGEVDEARRVLVNVHQKVPDSPDVNYSLAQLYVNQGSHDRAIELLDALLKAKPDDVEARLIIAQAYAQLSLSEEAMDQVKKVLELHPADPRALELAASIYRIIGQLDLAQAFLEKIDESQIDEARFPAVLAQLKLQKGDATEAMAICNRAISAGNIDPRVRLTLASIHNRGKNTGEEEVHLIAFVRENPGLHLGYFMLARFYSTQNVERGLEQFRTLRAFNETFSRLSEASLLNSAGRHEEALRVLAEGYGRVINSKHPSALSYARAMASIVVTRSGWRIEQVQPIYEALITADLAAIDAMIAMIDLTWKVADEATQLRRLGEATDALKANGLQKIGKIVDRYQRLNRPDKALEAIEKWLTREPKSILLLTAKGDLLAGQLKITESIAAYEQAVALAPETVLLFERLAQTFRLANDFPAVEKTLDRMARIDTAARIRALWIKVDLFIDLGLVQQAKLVVDELAKVSKPDDPRVLYTMGQCMALLDDMAGARTRLSLVPRHSPYYGSAQLVLARLDEAAGNPDAVRSRLEQLLAEKVVHAEAVQALIEWGIRNRDYVNLLKWSERAVQMDRMEGSSRMRWLRIRSVAQASTGDFLGLEKSLEQMVQLESTPSTRAARIAVLIQIGRLEDAKKLLASDAVVSGSDHGALLSLALSVSPDAGVKAKPLTKFLEAISIADAAKAVLAAEKLGAINNTVYASDLRELAGKLKLGSPTIADACRKLAMGIVALETGVPPLCERMANDVVGAHPEFTLAHALLLASAIAQDKSVDAIRNHILERLPDSSLAIYVRLHMATSARKWAEGIAVAAKLLEREPGHDHVTQRLVTLYKLAGDDQNATAFMKKLAAANGPFRDSAANDLAYRLAQAGGEQLEEARRIATELRRKYPLDPNIADTLGWIEHLRGDQQAAFRLLAFSVSRMSKSADVQYHIGAIYRALGNDRWAKMHLTAAASMGAGQPAAVLAADLLKTFSSSNAPVQD